MAKNKIGLQVKGLEEMIANLEAANASTKQAVENALKASKEYVNGKLIPDTSAGNFPAQGKYSTGQLKRSIDRNYNVNWQGTTAEIDIGYDFGKGGLTSVFLMYGTPKMPKVQKLYDDIYGARTQREIGKIQEAAITKVIERVQGG